MENKELYLQIEKAIKGDMKSTFSIILEFENVINSKCYINGRFDQECKDYIVDHLLKNIRKFKNFYK